MAQSLLLKGHFDGNSIVLDEPAALEVGQAVRVMIDPAPTPHPSSEKPLRPSRFGFAKGTFEMSADFEEPLDDFAEYR